MIPLRELERRCQKPDHRRVGNFVARRIARPAALRITWVVADSGVSANMATLAAWAAAVVAAAAFSNGTIAGWLVGAVLLQIWYVFDHVDGQLARLRGTASLDGAQLDYLMHHTVNLILPLAVGYGLFRRSLEPVWLLIGLVWGLSLLLVTLHHDARYRTFFQRLKRLHGTLQVVGGGGGRPEATPAVPRRPLRLAAWTTRKACEIHVVMNILTIIALIEWLASDHRLLLAQGYAAGSTVIAVVVTVASIARSQRSQAAEVEFSAWFRPAAGSRLKCVDGWWQVEAENAVAREVDCT